MPVFVDGGFLIDLLRSESAAIRKARELEKRGERILLATPALYEVMAGISFARSRLEAAAFRNLASRFEVMAFDEPAAVRAAELLADLMRAGKTKATADVMIAAMAIAAGHPLVTRDKDFRVMVDAAGLLLEHY